MRHQSGIASDRPLSAVAVAAIAALRYAGRPSAARGGSEQSAGSGPAATGHDDGHGFEQMCNALAGARSSRPAPLEPAARPEPPPAAAGPGPTERALMAAHGIAYDGRGYVLAGFRYARLADALLHARRSNAAR